MARFVIQPHVRLQEWVAEEHGYFIQEGLDYEFMQEGFAGASQTTGPVRRADSVPVEARSGAFEDMEQGRTCDVSAACHWAVNAAATVGGGRMWGKAYSVCPSAIFVAPESGYQQPGTWPACRWGSATIPAATTRPSRAWSSSSTGRRSS